MYHLSINCHLLTYSRPLFTFVGCILGTDDRTNGWSGSNGPGFCVSGAWLRRSWPSAVNCQPCSLHVLCTAAVHADRNYRCLSQLCQQTTGTKQGWIFPWLEFPDCTSIVIVCAAVWLMCFLIAYWLLLHCSIYNLYYTQYNISIHLLRLCNALTKICNWIYKEWNTAAKSCKIDVQNAKTDPQYSVVIKQKWEVIRKVGSVERLV